MACEVPSCDDSFSDELRFFRNRNSMADFCAGGGQTKQTRLDSKATQSTKEFHTLYLFAKYVLYFCYHFIVAPNSNLYLLLEYYELHHCQVYKSSPVEAIFSRFAVAYCRAC